MKREKRMTNGFVMRFHLAGLSDDNSKNYIAVVQYRRRLHTTAVEEPIDSSITDTSYDPDCTVKSLKQQQKHLSDREVQEIIRKYNSGISTNTLAKEYGCHRITGCNILKQNGIIIDKHIEGRKYRPEEVIHLYVDKMKLVSEIAKTLSVCDGAIYKCLKRHNISTKRTRWSYEL